MTCKIVNKEAATTKEKKTGEKSGSRMKRRVRGRVHKNSVYDRNSLRQESVKYSLNTESTHLVETEFKILQSLIPGISDQRDISELEIIDACVQYIETLQNQLEDHLVQNPHLNIQYQDSMIGNNPSSDLLSRLLQHGHQNLQANASIETTSRLTSVPSCDDTNSLTSSTCISNLSKPEEKNFPKHVSKLSPENKTKENSSSNYSHHKKYRMRL